MPPGHRWLTFLANSPLIPLAGVPLLTSPNVSRIMMTMSLMNKSYQAYGCLTAPPGPSNHRLPSSPSAFAQRSRGWESAAEAGRHELQAKEVIARSSQRV